MLRRNGMELIKTSLLSDDMVRHVTLMEMIDVRPGGGG
jgi:hypothetical protein